MVHENVLSIRRCVLFLFLISRGLVDATEEKYLDLSDIKNASLLVTGESNVSGITVTDPTQCVVESLTITKGCFLSPSLENCTSLTEVTLSGGGWVCGKNWSWLDKAQSKWRFNDSQADCVDVKAPRPESRVHRSVKFRLGRQKIQKLNLKRCPDECICYYHLTANYENLLSLRIKCDNANITDDTLPDFSIRTTSLFMERNQIRSTKSLFAKLSKLKHLTEIHLGYNKLTEIPFFDDDSFQKIRRLSLNDNNIREIDVEAFKSIVSREKVEIRLDGNDFRCGCNTHFFMKIALENSSKMYKFISKPLKCSMGSGGKQNQALMTLLPDECEESVSAAVDILPFLIAILSLLIILFIYFIYDLSMAIKECQRSSINPRVPKIDIIVRNMRTFIDYSCKSSSSDTTEDLADPTRTFIHDGLVVLRDKPSAIGNRMSVLKRQQSRRLTPGPS